MRAPAPHAAAADLLWPRVRTCDATTLCNFAWFAARRGAHDLAADALRLASAQGSAAAADGLRALEAGDISALLLTDPSATATSSPTNDSSISLAVAHHLRGEFAAAELAYRATLVDAAFAPAAWNGLGVLYEQRGERVAADSAWRRCIEADSVIAVYNHALALLRRGLVHRARAALRTGASSSQPFLPLLFLGGYAALLDGDAHAAHAWLTRAAAIEPDDARVQFTMALALERLQRHEDAAAAVRRAVRLSQRYRPQLWLLESGDGVVTAEIAAEVSAGDAAAVTHDAVLSLGHSLLRTAHLAEALAVFDQVLVDQPEQPEALFQRGIVLAKLRRYGEALADWSAVEHAAPASDLGHASRRHATSARHLVSLFAAG